MRATVESPPISNSIIANLALSRTECYYTLETHNILIALSLCKTPANLEEFFCCP